MKWIVASTNDKIDAHFHGIIQTIQLVDCASEVSFPRERFHPQNADTTGTFLLHPLYSIHIIHLLSKWRVEVTEIAMPHLRCIWIYFYRYIYVQNTDRFEVVPTTIYTQKTNTTAWHQSDWALYGCNVSLLTLHYITLSCGWMQQYQLS